MVGLLVTRGFSNGTLTGDIANIVTSGYTVNLVVFTFFVVAETNINAVNLSKNITAKSLSTNING